MGIFGSDQIKCSILAPTDSKGEIVSNSARRLEYSYSTLDGVPIPLEEIDIGQKEWKYKYPKEKKHYSWKFLSHTPDMLSQTMQRVAFQ
jgi:hypothetical protein